MKILDELRKTIDSIPRSPLDDRIVLIPANRFERQVETEERDENGEPIFKTESYLMPKSQFAWLLTECQSLGVEYILNEFIPTKDKDGKPCVHTMPKPKPLVGGDFGYFPKKF
jgi:hypothetical protein